jgi:hypothetical protein
MSVELAKKENEVNALSIIDTINVNQVGAVISKINQFQQIIHSQLKPKTDYGIIPGTDKPTLLKPGAEKILMLMGVTSEYELIERVQDYDKGFFAYTVKCILSKNGQIITEGLGHCNSRESKYTSSKVDPYTIANTCLKMAKKRAQIDAALTIASLSDVFTQDIEDMNIEGGYAEPAREYTHNDAANVTITFGKYRGKTLAEIYKTDKKYIEWLADKANKEDMRNAALALISGDKTSAQEKTEQEPLDLSNEDETELPY